MESLEHCIRGDPEFESNKTIRDEQELVVIHVNMSVVHNR